MSRVSWVEKATPYIQHLDDIFHGLEGNKAINPIARAIMSPAATIGGFSRGEFTNTLKKVYRQDVLDEAGKKIGRDFNYANIAGSAFTAGIGAGVLGGLTHDSAGNPDIAGIPMI